MNEDLIQVDGKFYKRSSIVMLPTERATNIYKDHKDKLWYWASPTLETSIAQHLYFLSNEEIKEGDTILCDDRNNISEQPIYSIQTVNKISNGWIFTNESVGEGHNSDWTKKIIATTDESLKIDYYDSDSYGIPQKLSLPRPSNEFLKKYCELGGIDEVMVEYYSETEHKTPAGTIYDISPSLLKVAPDNTITIKSMKNKLN